MYNKFKKYILIFLAISICFGSFSHFVFANDLKLKNHQKNSGFLNFVSSLAKRVKPVTDGKIISEDTNLTSLDDNRDSKYLVDLLADNNSAAVRDHLFYRAFENVLKKVSNNLNVIFLPEVKKALLDPVTYVQSYSYYKVDSDDIKKHDLVLRVKFNKKAVDKLLERSPEVKWVSDKPLTLLWVAKDMSGGKILNDTNDVGVTNIFRNVASEYGMSVVFPVLDLQEINGVTVNDICLLDDMKIKEISKRYGTSAIVIGCIKPSALDGGWSSKWSLLQGDEKQSFIFSGAELNEMLHRAMHKVSSNLDEKVTPVFSQVAKVVVRIYGVNGLEHYGQIVKYLRGFKKVIKRVELVSVGSATIDVSIDVIGGQPALLKLLESQSKLIPSSIENISSPGIDLNYVWVLSDNEKSKAAIS